jgi:transposase
MLKPLTVPEVRRLLQPGPPDAQQRRRAWSQWRRRHQATAQRCHTARRAWQQADEPRRCEPVVLRVPGTALLTEQRWAQILPILLPQKPARGRPANDHRRTLEGMLWVMHTGAAWREVPPAFGPWHTLHSRYQRWCSAGIWTQIIERLHATTTELPPWNSG